MIGELFKTIKIRQWHRIRFAARCSGMQMQQELLLLAFE
jgi:hypothetical protein